MFNEFSIIYALYPSRALSPKFLEKCPNYAKKYSDSLLSNNINLFLIKRDLPKQRHVDIKDELFVFWMIWRRRNVEVL